MQKLILQNLILVYVAWHNTVRVYDYVRYEHRYNTMKYDTIRFIQRR